MEVRLHRRLILPIPCDVPQQRVAVGMLQGKMQATGRLQRRFNQLVQACLDLRRTANAGAYQGRVTDNRGLGHGGLHKRKWREGRFKA